MTRQFQCGCGNWCEDEGYPTCVECEIHESDDCPACGSQMPSDRFCSCDINGPRYDTRYQESA